MWYVYIVECNNRNFYTGATNDIERRLKTHCAGRGARYTRIFGVKALVYQEACGDQSCALKREREIKRLTKDGKIKLISEKKKRRKRTRRTVERG